MTKLDYLLRDYNGTEESKVVHGISYVHTLTDTIDTFGTVVISSVVKDIL